MRGGGRRPGPSRLVGPRARREQDPRRSLRGPWGRSRTFCSGVPSLSAFPPTLSPTLSLSAAVGPAALCKAVRAPPQAPTCERESEAPKPRRVVRGLGLRKAWRRCHCAPSRAPGLREPPRVREPGRGAGAGRGGPRACPQPLSRTQEARPSPAAPPPGPA